MVYAEKITKDSYPALSNTATSFVASDDCIGTGIEHFCHLRVLVLHTSVSLVPRT